MRSENKYTDDRSRTIIRDLLNSPRPYHEKSTDYMMVEGQGLLAAGTDTSSFTLTCLTYHLLANPKVLSKLKDELAAALPHGITDMNIHALESLPYLNAIIRETLRMHSPAAFCMERIAAEEDLTYHSPHDGKTYILPRGTVIGMTAPLLSRLTSLYPDASTFRPERFIENPELEKVQIAFGRGTRRCVGENLAMAELRMITAALFRKYDVWDGTGEQKGPTLQLYETGREDVDMVSAFILPFPAEGRKGVRVVVRNGKAGR